MSATDVPPLPQSIDSLHPDVEAGSVSDPGLETASGRWVAFGLANLAVVLAVSLAGWYVLADPRLSPWAFSPLPFDAALFWAILFVVFVGFNAEFAAFNRLSQPWRGLAITVATGILAAAMTWVLAAGLGSVNADFAPGRDGSLGYFTDALFVLFGFGTFVIVVLNWQHCSPSVASLYEWS